MIDARSKANQRASHSTQLSYEGSDRRTDKKPNFFQDATACVIAIISRKALRTWSEKDGCPFSCSSRIPNRMSVGRAFSFYCAGTHVSLTQNSLDSPASGTFDAISTTENVWVFSHGRGVLKGEKQPTSLSWHKPQIASRFCGRR